MKMHSIYSRNRRKDISTKKIDIQRISTIVGVTILILAPIAYLIGTFYYYGYLNAFGVDSSHFPISTQETYINAYNALTIGLLKSIEAIITTLNENIIISIAIPFFMVVFFYILFHKKTVQTIRILIKKWNNFTSSDDPNRLALAAWASFLLTYISISIFYLLACVAITCWLAASISFNLGKAAAEKSISPYSKSGCHYENKKTWNSCIAIIEGNKVIYEGILVTANKEKIAIFDASGTKVIPNSARYVITRNYQR
ncbi:hypothetical protein [Aquitalea sp. FJL05]|uniref:hypothetical protein n=1 Tax=Aquitalea sp. FJL05 TaxID=2153366 RepID=UPI000F59DD41|nr:hypothetical protein [Aquitalea sp. FJL05]